MNIAFVFGLLRNQYFLSYKTSLTHKNERTTGEQPSLTADMAKYKDVILSAWRYHLSVIVIFCTTLVVFPAVTALIEPQNPGNF